MTQQRSRGGFGALPAMVAAGVLAVAGWAAAQQPCFDVRVFAGRGVGDGGPGAQAVFLSPRNVTVDPAGNVLVADAGNARIRRLEIDPTTGQVTKVTTLAGNGAPGLAQDGQQALVASLKEPSGVALDAAGNLFIADSGSHTIWKMTPDGVLHRAAGSGLFTGQIDGDHPGQAGNDPTDDLNDGQLATFATLNHPVRVVVDGANNLLISDLANNRLRRVDAASGRISTVLSAADGLNEPIGLALAPDGDLFIANRGTNQILKVTGSTVTVVVNASGARGQALRPDGSPMPALDSKLNAASEVAVDANGVLYIADTESNWILNVDQNGVISKVTGTGLIGFADGPAIFAKFWRPGVAIGSGSTLVIPDTDNHRIRRYDLVADSTTTIAGGDNSPGDGALATAALLDRPVGLAVDGSGNVYITEHDSHRVRRVDPGGTITTIVNQRGLNEPAIDGSLAADSPLLEPTGVAVDHAGNLLLVDTQQGVAGGSRVLLVDPAGVLHFFAGNGTAGSGGDGGPATSAGLNTPLRVAVATDGSVYIADFNNNSIRKVDTSGTISTFAGTGLNQPAGLTFDGAGTLYVADFANNRVEKVDPNGTVSTIVGTGHAGSDGDGGAASAASLDGPTDVAIARDGALLIVDQNNNKIRRVAPAGDGSLSGAGTITTLIGDGRPAFRDGPADHASLLIPTDVEVDQAGNILIADRGNQMVRIASPGTDCGSAAPCQTAADCDDSDPCTVDACQASGTCSHQSIGTGDCRPRCSAEPDGCIPGGGPAAVDCLSEVLVRAPLTIRHGKPAPVVRCHDGDQACDFDATAGQCTFRLAWCLNVTDSRIGCSASGVGQQTVSGRARDVLLRALGKLATPSASQTTRAVFFQPAFDSADTCTELVDVPVRLRAGGRRSGSMQIVSTAVSAGRPRRRDTDRVRLVCLP